MSSVSDRLRKLTDRSGPSGTTSGLADGPLRFGRNLFHDLVDRNLWPVALMLCVAIVAIPIVLSRGPGGAGATAVPAPATAPKTGVSATDAIKLVGPPLVKTRPGKQLDPFRHPAEKKAPATGTGAPPGVAAPSATTPAAATPSGGTSSGGTSSGGTSSGGTPSTGTTSTGTPPSAATPAVNPATVYYRTEARWSLAETSPARPISRLTPLGDAGEPGVLYLGVSNLGYAMFLLSPTAQAEASTENQPGKVGCENEPNCRIVGLKAGATQVVIVPASEGGKARRFHLQAVSVKRVVTTLAAARRMRAQEHSKGRAVLREMASDPLNGPVLDKIRYDEATGLLVLTSGDKKTTK
jgi:hypothetical protein